MTSDKKSVREWQHFEDKMNSACVGGCEFDPYGFDAMWDELKVNYEALTKERDELQEKCARLDADLKQMAGDRLETEWPIVKERDSTLAAVAHLRECAKRVVKAVCHDCVIEYGCDPTDHLDIKEEIVRLDHALAATSGVGESGGKPE